jgi:dTDP-4-amino-4,6-dideoxygalactose transaminase
MDKPAFEGGKPVRDSFLPFSQPFIGDKEIDEVTKVMKSGWLTIGPTTKEFEEKFKAYVGAKAAVPTNSCTGAMHTSLLALGIKHGDEVITSTLTYTATAHVIAYTGAKPVLVDIDPRTYNLNVELVRKKITKNTKAIIPVHYAGQPCDMKEIDQIAQEHKLRIVEDAAHAIGAEHDGKKIGGLGNPTCFSFYPIKNMTAAEGGMMTTNDENLAEKIRKLTFFGIDRSTWKRYGKGGQWYYEVQDLGYRYNMTDIQAAIGKTQLDKLDEFNKKRREFAKYLTSRFSKLKEIQTPAEKDGRVHCWHLYPIVIKPDLLTIDRNKFIEALATENIGTSVHFIPVHKHPYYQRTYGYTDEDFPVANKIFEGLLSLPLYPKMSQQDLEDVAIAVEKIVQYYRK